MSTAKKIIVFGDLPVATKVAILIAERQDCELTGVVIGNEQALSRDPFDEKRMLWEYAREMSVPIYRLEELPERFGPQELDLGVTARFSRILSQQVIDLFKIGVVNFHGGLLPEVRGVYSSTHSLLEGHSHGGGTLHWVDEGIDTGKLLRRCEFPIEKSDTGISVFQKTQEALYREFADLLPDLLDDKKRLAIPPVAIPEGTSSRYYGKKSLEGLKEVNLKNLASENPVMAERELNRIRAFDFPGHEPAYCIHEGVKIYLTLSHGWR